MLRYRRSVIEERTREAARVQKVLEGANIKLGSVASDVLGVSGRAMLRRLVAGETDAEALAGLARGRLRRKQPELVRALEGGVGAHQRLLLAEQLRHIEELEERLARLDAEIDRRMAPFESALEALDSRSGPADRSAVISLTACATWTSTSPSPIRGRPEWCYFRDSPW